MKNLCVIGLIDFMGYSYGYQGWAIKLPGLKPWLARV